MRAPAVIIGVGGIGSDICARIERMLPQDAPDRGVFRFVIMDTDVNTIRDIKRNGFGGTTIRLSDNMTVNKCLEMLKRGSLADWYPENGIFANKAMTEGAGQYRSVSRLAFEYAVHETKLDDLKRIIKELDEISMEGSEQPIRFYIISSLAGGTGSGIALPVALYINRFYMEEKKQALFSCKGFFLLSSALRQLGSARLEQESIDANAYAAVKEISAYMREADQKHGRYSRSEIDHDGEADLNAINGGKIYEYCYMFGMTNRRGHTVHSFEDLKDLVANAVYMQACSPMHDMNSSLEDNTIKHLVQLAQRNQEGFLRRFGGIGCGELVYPYEKLKQYLAMRWAEDMIEERWQIYDTIFFELRREQEQKRRQGKKFSPVDQGTEYIRTVDNAVNDALAEEILAVCCPEDVEPVWEQYLGAMYDKIAGDIEKEITVEMQTQGSLLEKCDFHLHSLQNSHNRDKQRMESRNELRKLLQDLHQVMMGKQRRMVDSYAKAWFVPHEVEDVQEPYLMEYWLVHDGQFIHPNAVRYFLYQLKDAVTVALENMNDKNEDDENIDDIIHNLENYTDKKKPWFRTKRYFEHSYGEYDNIYNGIVKHTKQASFYGILEKCKEYVEHLTIAYEQFYESCSDMLERFEQDCHEVEDMLDRDKGLCLSYVCADRECRSHLFEDIHNAPTYAQAGRDLSEYIYRLIQGQPRDKKRRQYMYYEFLNHWIDLLEKEFAHLVNMDILEAIQKQELYKSGRTMDADRMKRYIQGVEEKLIDPFLQYAQDCGHQQGISLCCYNESLGKKNSVHREIVKWLHGRRGVPDQFYCSPYQIMFYRSMVGLNASEILEFLHRHSYDTPLQKGKAFRSYENNIIGINQQRDKKSLLTPHIDKNWHCFLDMPDTNETYQREMELKICVVFFYTYVTGKITGTKEKKYMFHAYKNENAVPMGTLRDCHLFLYQNPSVVRTFALEMLEDARAYKDGAACKFLEKLGCIDGGIFKIILDYYAEIESEKHDLVPYGILLDAISALIGLYAESVEELQVMFDKYLSDTVLHECRQGTSERRIQNIRVGILRYLNELDAVEINQLCTRLFYIEMEMLKARMGES